ncbi:hypothetical protein Droror1_Dr00025049 [Drosera rotundifolia]
MGDGRITSLIASRLPNEAEVCPNDSCGIRIHKYCLVKKYSLAKVDKVCPGCSSPWPYEATKAEILEYLDEPHEPPATQLKGCAKGKKRIAEHPNCSQEVSETKCDCR